MTISTTNRKAGPFEGDGIVAVFPFEFKVFEQKDLLVVRTDLVAYESELVLGLDYTVALNDDQDQTPGGSVVLAVALPVGFLLTVISGMDYLQPIKITNQGGFYPKVFNDAFDRLTIFAQQLAEQVSRSIKVSVSGSTNPDELIGELQNSAARAEASAKAAAQSEHEFKLQYLGAHATAPTIRYDGSPLQAGDYYFNTTDDKPYIFSGGVWVETISDSYDALAQAITALDTSKADKDEIPKPEDWAGTGLKVDGGKLALDKPAVESGFTIIYPNGGTEAAPANIKTNTRYVMDNPFPGKRVSCWVEMFHLAEWAKFNGIATLVTSGGAGLYMGALANPLGLNTIVLQTASSYLIASSGVDGNPWGSIAGTAITTLPARVVVELSSKERK